MRNAFQDRADDHTDRVLRFSTRLRACLSQRGHAIVPVDLARDFAMRTGRPSTAQTVSNWLNAMQMPTQTNLMALAEWLGTTAEALADGTPLLHFAPSKVVDPDAHQIAEQFQSLGPYGRRCAKAMMAAMVRMEAGAA